MLNLSPQKVLLASLYTSVFLGTLFLSKLLGICFLFMASCPAEKPSYATLIRTGLNASYSILAMKIKNYQYVPKLGIKTTAPGDQNKI